MPRRTARFGRLVTLAALVAAVTVSVACGAIGFDERPARDYVYSSGAPLGVAVIDETGGNDWSPAIRHAIGEYAAATPYLDFGADPVTAHIVVRVRRYSDGAPPQVDGYLFQSGVGGFAAVYDAEGAACNFPPATIPLGCSGEIARADIYLNDIIPPGADIEARRQRLVLHELGHALGLTRHSPALDIDQLAQRYGWR